MSKKKRPAKPKAPVFPPDIFWIEPGGKVRNIIGHATAIQAKPEVYGFHAAPRTREEVDEAFSMLFEQGWVRGRYSSGTFSFQMDRPRGVPMGNAYDLVLRFQAEALHVEVDFWDPYYKAMAKSMTAQEFLAQQFPKHWGLGRAGWNADRSYE